MVVALNRMKVCTCECSLSLSLRLFQSLVCYSVLFYFFCKSKEYRVAEMKIVSRITNAHIRCVMCFIANPMHSNVCNTIKFVFMNGAGHKKLIRPNIKKMSGKKSERERVRRISESPAVFVLYTVYELNGILSPVFTHTSAIFKIQAHDYMDRLSAK